MTAVHDHVPAPAPAAQRARATFLTHAPRVISSAAVALGLLLIAEVLIPHRWRTAPLAAAFVPEPARATAEAVVMVSGWLLLRIARGLGKRKRTEWRVAITVCVAVTAADLLRSERRPIEAVITAALLAGLVLARSQYTATADPRGRSFALRIAGQFLTVAIGYGMALLYLPGHVSGAVSVWSRLREVLASLIGLGGWITISSDHYADLFHATLLIFGLVTLVSGVIVWLRPVQPRSVLAPADESRLRELLQTQGARDSLGYFALRRDKSVVWSPSGKAAITYRVVCGVALVSGDPIGDPEAWPAAIAAYRNVVDKFGWTPAVMGCGELGATIFRREYGLRAIALGDEAILATNTFSLHGRDMRGVRQACSRVRRAGYTVQVRRTSLLSADERAQICAAAASWRVDPVERGFSMALSRLGDPRDPDCVIVTAHQNGQLRGLLHFVPWGRDGISLDLMRRDRTSDNGVNEFMIVELVQARALLGITKVSLNFAVFRDALDRGERIGAGPVLRLWRRILLVASRWYQIESLYRFNDKFAPHWQPRFISYSRARDIPRIALAALEAEAFIVRPEKLNRMLRREE